MKESYLFNERNENDILGLLLYDMQRDLHTWHMLKSDEV